MANNYWSTIIKTNKNHRSYQQTERVTCITDQFIINNVCHEGAENARHENVGKKSGLVTLQGNLPAEHCTSEGRHGIWSSHEMNTNYSVACVLSLKCI